MTTENPHILFKLLLFIDAFNTFLSNTLWASEIFMRKNNTPKNNYKKQTKKKKPTKTPHKNKQRINRQNK